MRAPLPTVTDRLYGDTSIAPAPRRPADTRPTARAAFRDFRAEAAATPGAGLGALFAPPLDLLHGGDLASAAAAAAATRRWLVANVQSEAIFASHLLNRDTWTDPALRALLPSFVLWQADSSAEAGAAAAEQYKLNDLPAILVLDPATGAAMRTWTGFVTAAALLEGLIPFADAAFDEPGAAALADRGRTGIARRVKDLAAAAAGDGRRKHRTEEEELAAALAASAAEVAVKAVKGKGGEEEGEEAEAGPSPPRPPPTVDIPAIQAAAAARLPPEPEDGGGVPVRVRVGGDAPPLARRFPLDAKVSAVMDAVISVDAEAAAGRHFVLREAVPGTPDLKADAKLSDVLPPRGGTLMVKWEA